MVKRFDVVRVAVTFDGRAGDIALDQIRTIGKGRIVTTIGTVEPAGGTAASRVLRRMFS